MTVLTDRMRTCVAHLETIEISTVLTDDQMEAIIDARRLLAEASDTLEAAGVGTVIMNRADVEALDLQAEVIETIPPPLPGFSIDRSQPGFWYDNAAGTLPHQPSRNACPNCDSRAAKTVRARGKTLEMECPVCGTRWKR